MNVAVLSESPADETALRILVDSILGIKTQATEFRGLKARGAQAVLDSLPAVIRHLHYRTDADALVVSIDSNGFPIHTPEHDKPGQQDKRCRLCQLRAIVSKMRHELPPRAHRAELKIAAGLATPAIEAWYLCGRRQHATEAAWARELAVGVHAPTAIRGKYKRLVYGTELPLLPHETQRATEHVRALVERIARLERAFPNGFGPLAREIRGWREAGDRG